VNPPSWTRDDTLGKWDFGFVILIFVERQQLKFK